MTTGGAWMLLVASGLTDVAWAYAAKRADGFSHLGWGAASVALLVLFIALLTKALQRLPLGAAYVVWTGIGAVGAVIVGAVLLKEPVTGPRLGAMALVVLGVIGLRLQT
ncbi:MULTISPECIES: multidrug efflux SMR transporter [unclassified Caulobacter]|uniref:DMT family transporter n=1 Tax=unclassified Caulobacter TaxID=2648921 RepID=UPI0006F4DD04|nr:MULTISPECIES: multidrug efflux SMR transporter [unclassified Caulobacter]KQV58863.1 hypothetical protein ASC62_08865 [Caulobacter sp. Root342]KQV68627.1 hypothetical protein ASC70_07170 [Caulobacter sp. Root343]